MWSSVSERHPSEPFPASPGRLVLRTFHPLSQRLLSLSLSLSVSPLDSGAQATTPQYSPFLPLVPRSLSRPTIFPDPSSLFYLRHSRSQADTTDSSYFSKDIPRPAPLDCFCAFSLSLALFSNASRFFQFPPCASLSLDVQRQTLGRLFTLGSRLTRRRTPPRSFVRR